MSAGPGHRITPEQPCRLCGGTTGGGWDGAHALCAARADRGAPTPSLGTQCTCCQGSGCHPRSVFGPINPNQDAVDRWAPACATCGGRGYLGGEDLVRGSRLHVPKYWATACEHGPGGAR